MDIKLRNLEKSDNQQIANLLNNKKIWDNLKDHIPHPYTLEDADYFIDLVQKESSPNNAFAIVKDGQELCGVIGLVKQGDIYRMTAELGYWIGDPFWGNNIATRAIKLITDYGFSELLLERIFAGVFGFNKPSMSVLEKNGYKKEGIFRNSVIKNDIIQDEYIYAKLKNE
jgi:RimJ/RimL family protein N-acetyltransferase